MTCRVLTYAASVSRWAPDARERLERAALTLFAEQGYQATTVPQITERAGLTTRTFFRYFADKREVIFAGDEIPERARRMLAEAPAGVDPRALVADGLHRLAVERFDGRRVQVAAIRDLIAREPALQERDLRKRADTGEVVRIGLEARGADPLTAALLADLAMTVLHVALDRWSGDVGESREMSAVVDEVFSASAGLFQWSGRAAS